MTPLLITLPYVITEMWAGRLARRKRHEPVRGRVVRGDRHGQPPAAPEMIRASGFIPLRCERLPRPERNPEKRIFVSGPAGMGVLESICFRTYSAGRPR